MLQEKGFRYLTLSKGAEGVYETVELNISDTFLTPSAEVSSNANTANSNYEHIQVDIWVAVALSSTLFTFICVMCSCLVCYKFYRWSSRVVEARNSANLEAGTSESELPSYTIASGLPTYEEALEQLKQVKELTGAKSLQAIEAWTPHTPPTPAVNTLSVANLFPLYRSSDNACSLKAS